MDPALNPFAPGAGTQPPALTGRDKIMDRAKVSLRRVHAGRLTRSSLLVGLRGVGKTVLLNRIHRDADEMGYHTAFIEAPEGMRLAELLVPPLRKILLRIDRGEGRKAKLHAALGSLHSFASTFKVSYGELGIEITEPTGIADSGSLELDLIDLFVSMGEAAKEASCSVAILIDELQYVKNEELAALLSGIHRVGQLNLPIIVFGAGLPQLTGLTGKAKSYAERLFDFEVIGPLPDEAARCAITEPLKREGVTIRKEALDALIEATEGYPYFLQEWGKHSWDLANKTPIDLADVQSAGKSAIEKLDASFFRVRFDRLTAGEKEYLRAMAGLGAGPHRSGDIADELGRTVEQAAVTRANIISKGMIYSPSHGDNAFTVPKFHEYMIRVMPDFTPTPVKTIKKKDD